MREAGEEHEASCKGGGLSNFTVHPVPGFPTSIMVATKA